MKTKRKPVQASNIFMCMTCNDNKELSVQEMKEHLKTAHGIEECKGTRSMTINLDAEYYKSTYEWDIQGVKLAQSTVNPRRKDDMMRFV